MKILNAKEIKNPVVYEIIYELIEKAVSSELINHQKVECCEIINDQKDELIENIESSELINDQKHECCELIDEIIEHKKISIIRHQKVEYINMLKSSRNGSHKTKELGLTMKELKAISRKRGVKNYENLSRIRLVEEINKLEPSKELKKKKIVSSLLLRGKKNIGFKLKKKKY